METRSTTWSVAASHSSASACQSERRRRRAPRTRPAWSRVLRGRLDLARPRSPARRGPPPARTRSTQRGGAARRRAARGAARGGAARAGTARTRSGAAAAMRLGRARRRDRAARVAGVGAGARPSRASWRWRTARGALVGRAGRDEQPGERLGEEHRLARGVVAVARERVGREPAVAVVAHRDAREASPEHRDGAGVERQPVRGIARRVEAGAERLRRARAWRRSTARIARAARLLRLDASIASGVLADRGGEEGGDLGAARAPARTASPRSSARSSASPTCARTSSRNASAAERARVRARGAGASGRPRMLAAAARSVGTRSARSAGAAGERRRAGSCARASAEGAVEPALSGCGGRLHVGGADCSRRLSGQPLARQRERCGRGPAECSAAQPRRDWPGPDRTPARQPGARAAAELGPTWTPRAPSSPPPPRRGRRGDRHRAAADPELLEELALDLLQDLGVLAEERLRLLAALADPLAAEAEPGAALLDDVLVRGEVEEVALAADARGRT